MFFCYFCLVCLCFNNRYALERHMTKYQTVWPREPVGKFRDENVFPRAAVREVLVTCASVCIFAYCIVLCLYGSVCKCMWYVCMG